MELKNEFKILNQIITEPDEFKRYILLQLWITQLYTSTIIAVPELSSNDSKIQTSPECLYKTFQNLKKQLEMKNKKLKEVYENVQNKYILLKCMNELLSLDSINFIHDLKIELDSIKEMIDKNVVYITNINNLSEAKIEDAINKPETN